MKKFFKRFLLFFCLPLIIFIAFVFGSTFYIRNWMPERFDYQDHTEHFNISYNESEKSAIADIENRLKSNYDRITNDLKQQMDKPVNIKIYPDLNTFQFAAKLRSGLYWWVDIFLKESPKHVGVTDHNTGDIRMVSPLNPGENGFTYDIILSVAVHEFTHAVALKIIPNQNSLMSGFGLTLNEGLATYESGQGPLLFEKEQYFTNGNLLKMVPESIDKLSMSDENIYKIGYSLVKYVIDNYGYDKIIELLKKDYSGGNYDSETRALYDEWIEYLKANQN